MRSVQEVIAEMTVEQLKEATASEDAGMADAAARELDRRGILPDPLPNDPPGIAGDAAACPECGSRMVHVGMARRCARCTYGWPWHGAVTEAQFETRP